MTGSWGPASISLFYQQTLNEFLWGTKTCGQSGCVELVACRRCMEGAWPGWAANTSQKLLTVADVYIVFPFYQTWHVCQLDRWVNWGTEMHSIYRKPGLGFQKALPGQLWLPAGHRTALRESKWRTAIPRWGRNLCLRTCSWSVTNLGPRPGVNCLYVSSFRLLSLSPMYWWWGGAPPVAMVTITVLPASKGPCLSWCMWVCVCVWVCMCTCMGMCMCVCMQVCTCVYACMCVSVPVRVPVCIQQRGKIKDKAWEIILLVFPNSVGTSGIGKGGVFRCKVISTPSHPSSIYADFLTLAPNLCSLLLLFFQLDLRVRFPD